MPVFLYEEVKWINMESDKRGFNLKDVCVAFFFSFLQNSKVDLNKSENSSSFLLHHMKITLPTLSLGAE